MNPARRLLLVAVCALGVLVVAATFPAADPRLDPPASTEGGAAAGDWEDITETPERSSDYERPERNETVDDPDIDLTPIVEGDLVPGTVTRVGVSGMDLRESEYHRVTMLVDGERAGSATADDLATFRVPEGTETVNVTVAETGDSRDFAVDTDIDVAVVGHLFPGGDAEVAGRIGNYSISNATVYVDGESAGTTATNGTAVVDLPDTAGETEIRIERDSLSGSYTATVPEPEVSFTSPLVFPGAPAHVSVTADGTTVENATVAVGDSRETTGSGGGTWITVPLADEVTVTGTVGAEQARTTVSNLYLRTTFVVLVLPGLAIGALWTYLRYAPRRVRWGHGLPRLALRLSLVVGALSTFFAGLATQVAAARPGRGLRLALSGFRLPGSSFSLPSVPSLSLGVPSFASLFDSFVGQGPSRDASLTETVRSALSGTDDDRTTDTTDGDGESATAERVDSVPDERTQLREIWHAFLDHVGVRDRETATPGEASRDALAAGYPRESVERLLSLFRDVEYGERAPSSEDVTDARTALETLLRDSPEEDSE